MFCGKFFSTVELLAAHANRFPGCCHSHTLDTQDLKSVFFDKSESNLCDLGDSFIRIRHFPAKRSALQDRADLVFF